MQITNLTALLAGVSERADLPTLTTSSFITKPQMERWLNQSARRLMSVLISAHGEGHFETTQTLSTTADQDYSRPTVSGSASATDIYRVTGLRVTIDGHRLRLRRASAAEIDMEDDNSGNGWTVARPPKWVFREHTEQRFVWTRTPTAVHAVKIHYVPYFVFVNTNETTEIAVMTDGANHGIHAYMGWDEWVILDCAIKAMKRQSQPAEEWQALMIEQRGLEEEIRAAAATRTDEPQKIQQTYFEQDTEGRWPTA